MKDAIAILAGVLLLAVLMALLFPCRPPPVDSVRKVDTQLAKLQMAMQHYYQQYQAYPLVPAGQGDHIYGDDQPELIKRLSGHSAAGGDHTAPLVFFEVPEDMLNEQGALIDPWGTALRVAVDADGDGVITLGGKPAESRVAVWSCGRNRVDESGAGDDRVSW